MTEKILIGKGKYNSNVYLEGGVIRFTGDSTMHKTILDELKIYADFYPMRSGTYVYIILSIDYDDPLKMIERIRKIEKKIGLKLYEMPKILPKLDKLVLKKI